MEMVEQTQDKTWETTRLRFIVSLPQRLAVVEQTLSLLVTRPDERSLQNQLLRQLQTLLASAEVFSLEALVPRLRDASAIVDRLLEVQAGAVAEDIELLERSFQQIRFIVNHMTQVKPDTQVSTNTAQTTVLPPQQNQPTPLVPDHPQPAPTSNLEKEQIVSAQLLPGSLITVLVIDTLEVQAQIKAALPANHFDVKGAEDVDEALRWARSGTPDVLLVDRGYMERSDNLIARLRSDPLTDFIPTIVMTSQAPNEDVLSLREQGVAEVVSKPINGAQLIKTLGDMVGVLAASDTGEQLGDATCVEIADWMIAEIRNGLVERAQNAEGLRIPMGDGAEVLAACWSAIASVRAQIAHRSGGRVVFRDPLTSREPALFSLAEDDAISLNVNEVNLRGRRVIVADDDPAVVWFFSGLLRSEGMDVTEVSSAPEAIEQAHRRYPDLIVSDILMPGMDGFVLCRELKRDPALCDIRVILLSWKDDLLMRMRELHAQAAGYLRKEAASTQIIARVRQALLPLATFENKLSTGTEVRGRVEDIGIIPLLRSVAARRPNARITVRDAWSVLEVRLREGHIVDVSVTGREGIFGRGDKVLPQLFGCISGSYSIVEDGSEIAETITSDLEQTIQGGTSRLGALLEAVSGGSIMNIHRIVLDPKMVEAFVATSPKSIGDIIERLHAGEGPRFLLLNSNVDPQQIEFILRELARRGAIRQVHGPREHGRLAEGLRHWLPSVPATPPPVPKAATVTERGIGTKGSSGTLKPAAPLRVTYPDREIPTERLTDDTLRSLPDEIVQAHLFKKRGAFWSRLMWLIILTTFAFGVSYGWLMYGKGDQALRSIWQKLSARVFPAKGLDIFQGKPASSPARRQPSQPALEGDGAFYGQVRPPLPTEPVLAEGQGLVQLPPHWTGSNLRLWVDDRETKWQGKPLVLEQGYHEIRVRLGGSLSQRFIVVQAGKVHVLD